MEITIKGFITSKESELFSDCADRYAFNQEDHKFAISDGVSKSFFSKYWAEILVNKVVTTNITNANYITECQDEWLKKVNEIVNKPTTKWFTQNAFNNNSPALATFVGLIFFEKEKKWRAIARGDSFLFFIPKERNCFNDITILSSKTEPIVFDNFPDYFTSIGNKHKGKIKHKNGDLKNGTFYLMTDALAEWLINEKDNAIEKIEVWQNQKDFECFVDEERKTKRLGNDDSAILIIEIKENYFFSRKFTYSKESYVSDIYKLISVQEKEIAKSKDTIIEESPINDNDKNPLEEI